MRADPGRRGSGPGGSVGGRDNADGARGVDRPDGLDDLDRQQHGHPRGRHDGPARHRGFQPGSWLAAVVASPLLALAALAGLLSLALPLGTTRAGQALHWNALAQPFVFACCGLFAALLAMRQTPRLPGSVLGFAVLALIAGFAPLLLLASPLPERLDAAGWRFGFWCDVLALAILATESLRRLAAQGGAPPGGDAADPSPDRRALRGHLARAVGRSTPLFFGAWVLVFWQLLVGAFQVPPVLLPAPSSIGDALVRHLDVLGGDVVQTVLHSVLVGLGIGCGLGLATGIAIDRSPFLQRGLLPLTALASAVPLIGLAPIMVMWFGFDWPSKAAVVAVMTFFPMLVNVRAGLTASGRLERDLMRSYGAGHWRTLVALRLPVALPFVFAALKIDSTLALIGAIVAEFFGSPTAGLGFRISTEAARLNMALVWAAIGVAALAGSALYGAIVWLERRATFWHPAVRAG